MVYAEHTHVGAASRAPLLHRLGGGVEHPQEGHGAGGASPRGAHEVVLRPEAREGEACAPARLVNDGRGLDRVEDLGHGIANGQDVAGRVLEMIVLARIHEGRRVWKKLPFHHHVVEGRGDLAHSGQAPAKALFGARDGEGHPPAHLLGGLRRLTIAADQVALSQHPQGGLGPAPHLRRSS